jgi:hypothetical protein
MGIGGSFSEDKGQGRRADHTPSWSNYLIIGIALPYLTYACGLSATEISISNASEIGET